MAAGVKPAMSSGLSYFPLARHANRKTGIQRSGWQTYLIDEAWVPAIPTGMSILVRVII